MINKYTTNKLALEPYEGSGKIEAQVSSGFATVKQKTTLVGLRLLADVRIIQNGSILLCVGKGAKIYFTEETLHAAAWSKKTYECAAIEGKFILAEPSQVELVDYEDEDEIKKA